jgi:hypothetical protein
MLYRLLLFCSSPATYRVLTVTVSHVLWWLGQLAELRPASMTVYCCHVLAVPLQQHTTSCSVVSAVLLRGCWSPAYLDIFRFPVIVQHCRIHALPLLLPFWLSPPAQALLQVLAISVLEMCEPLRAHVGQSSCMSSHASVVWRYSHVSGVTVMLGMAAAGPFLQHPHCPYPLEWGKYNTSATPRHH